MKVEDFSILNHHYWFRVLFLFIDNGVFITLIHGLCRIPLNLLLSDFQSQYVETNPAQANHSRKMLIYWYFLWSSSLLIIAAVIIGPIATPILCIYKKYYEILII